MYETEQNIVIGPKKNLFTTVTLVSKILALVLFVVLPFAGFYLGIKYEHSLDITPSTSASAPTKTITDNFQDDSQKHLLMTKVIEGGKISAYRLLNINSVGFNNLIFTIILEAGSAYQPAIYSFSSEGFGEDGFFEIFGTNTLLVLNAQTNKIDVFDYNIEKTVNDVIYPSNLVYRESIGLPKYKVGTIYSIKCDKEECAILTAFHLEAGCNMALNLQTRQYSNIKCMGMGVEFTPELL